jgi:tetratricopeptide (TPR) repeat protein
MRKYKEAIQDFETSHKLGEPEYLYNRNYADVYKAQKIYDKALQYYTLAVQEDPDQPSSFLRDRGQIYYELKLYKEAIEDLTAYIEDENLQDYYSYYYRGLSYQATNEETLATTDFLLATPDMLVQGYKNLYRNLYDNAFKVFSEILVVDENNVRALIGRARALTGLNKYADALPDINHAIELDPTNSEAYGVRSVIYANLSNMEGAIADWKAILLYSESQDEIDWANKAMKDAGVTP